MRTRRTSGLTLLELLVLLFLVFCAVGLFAVWALRSREVPRRNLCLARQQALSLAHLKYEQLQGGFCGYRNRLENTLCATWVVPVLPFLDQADLYQAWTAQPAPESPPAPYLPALVCPDVPNVAIREDQLSYVVNAGLAENPALWNGIFFDACPEGDAAPPQMTLAYLNAHDGAEHTLLLSENILAGGWGQREPAVYDVGFVWHRAGLDNGKHPERQINGDLDYIGPVDLNYARPSSYHPGGVVAAYADGHADFLADTMDYRVYQQLMTPNDQEGGE